MAPTVSLLPGKALPIRATEASTWEVKIFIAGSIGHCKELLSEYAMRGACYSVDPTTFIYTGGREDGMVVRLINYPRFPSSGQGITDAAIALAEFLIIGLHQHSCTVQAPDRTIWLSRRPE